MYKIIYFLVINQYITNICITLLNYQTDLEFIKLSNFHYIIYLTSVVKFYKNYLKIF